MLRWTYPPTVPCPAALSASLSGEVCKEIHLCLQTENMEISHNMSEVLTASVCKVLV